MGMLELSGTLKPVEFVRFQYFHVLRRMRALLIAGMLVFPLVLLAIVTTSLGQELIRYVFIALFIMALVLLIGPYWSTRRQLARQPYLSGVRHVFTPDGIHSDLQTMSAELKWTAIQKIRETKTLFLLYYAPNIALILPKRFFSDNAQMDEWRSLIQNSIDARKISALSLLGRCF